MMKMDIDFQLKVNPGNIPTKKEENKITKDTNLSIETLLETQTKILNSINAQVHVDENPHGLESGSDTRHPIEIKNSFDFPIRLFLKVNIMGCTTQCVEMKYLNTLFPGFSKEVLGRIGD